MRIRAGPATPHHSCSLLHESLHPALQCTHQGAGSREVPGLVHCHNGRKHTQGLCNKDCLLQGPCFWQQALKGPSCRGQEA